MKKAILTASALLLLGCSLTAHALSEPETHNVVNIYEKKELERGSLNEEGEEISFVLVPTKLEAGKYDVEICDNVSLRSTTSAVPTSMWNSGSNHS